MKKITCRYCNSQFTLTIQEKIHWQNNNCVCPVCNTDWCILPKTERELKKLQDIYLKNRDTDVLSHIAYTLFRYASSIIKKKYVNYLRNSDDLFNYSYNATVFVIDDYLSKEDFKIDTSFAGYLKFKIKQAIFTIDKEDKKISYSLNYEFKDHNQLEEVLQIEPYIYHTVPDVIDDIENKDYNRYLYKKIILLLNEIQNYCTSAQDYIRIIGLYLFFNKGENTFNDFFNLINRNSKDITLKSLEILKSELLQLNIK